ncbi:MAG TPA: ATP-binding protein, partial [Polyangia bacterium]
EFEVVILDLDIDPATPPVDLCAQVVAACKDTPIVVVAGLNARHRLVQALAHPDVVGIVPKIGAWTETATTEAKLEGPDEQALGLALRRRVERSTQAVGPAPYLLAGTPIEERLIGGSIDKDEALAALLADAARFGLSDEKVRRIETAADELMLNAVYDAPRDERGGALHAEVDRTRPVVLAAQAQVRTRWGCDGRTFVVSVADRFGALDRATVATHVQRLLDARSPRLGRSGTSGGAGLGLVLTYSAANQLALQISRGRFTEATAALHVAGSNRAAVARGSALHIYD